MPSLSYFLDRTDQSIRSIQSLKFKSPGIFTNAIVKKPNITILLKDPTIDESSLYKIVKPTLKKRRITTRKGGVSVINEYIGVKPERVDGKSVYVDKSFSEIVQSTSGGGNNKDKEGDDDEGEGSNKRSIVQLPELIHIPSDPVLEPSSSPTKRGGNSTNIYNHPYHHQINSYFNISPSSDDIEKLINKTNKLIQKYPTLIKNQAEVINNLNQYQENYDELAASIQDLEHDIKKQRKQLNILNINYSDIGSPVKEGHVLTQDDDDDSDEDDEDQGEEDFDVDEYIRKEEQEIEELEQQLNQRQRI
ncbi:DASH complex subunit Spc34 [Scheffersomyces coipomensis]|uniref:DASH complex subunit Spc34 n=1 Tax=Scheffersomyces coipomensis TaxID=1788519 RepID=UPI00315D134F